MLRRQRSPYLLLWSLIALALLMGCGVLSQAALQPGAEVSARPSPTPPPIPTRPPLSPTPQPESGESGATGGDESESAECTNQAELVAHVTIPLGMEIAASTSL